jgi:hypothetical protein
MISPVSRIVAAVIAAVSFVTPVSRDTERRETLTRIDQTREFRECKEILATNNTLSKHLTRDNFVSLLQKVSPEGVKFRCENLPLEQCSCFFNMHACRNGKDCIGNQANILISSSEERDLFCFTLASMLGQSLSTPLP